MLFMIQIRSVIYFMLFLSCAIPTLGGSHTAESDNFTIDTCAGVTVCGRVLDGSAQKPYPALSGATVSLGDTNSSSSSDGRFEFKTSLDSEKMMTVSGTEFASWQQSVGPLQSGNVLDLGVIILRKGNGPIVESVTLSPKGIYVEGWGLEADLKVKVNWNGSTPKEVRVYANNNLKKTIVGSGTICETSLALDDCFTGALTHDANKLKVIAESSDGINSDPLEQDITVIPIPTALSKVIVSDIFIPDSWGEIECEISFPAEPVEKMITLPVIGKFGGAFSVVGYFKYIISSGEWELALGGENSEAKVVLGKFDAGAKIEATGEGTATKGNGIKLDTVSLNSELELKGKFDLAKISLLDFFLPSVTTALNKIPKVGKILNTVSIVIELEPNFTGGSTFALYPEFDFESAELTGKMALNAAYKPEVSKYKLRIYIGGEPSITFQVPGDFFKEVGFKAYAGIEAIAWIFKYEAEFTFVNFTYPSRRLPLGAVPVEGGYMLPAADNATASFVPMTRPWIEDGGETFLLESVLPRRRLSTEVKDALASQDLFVRMGGAASLGAVYQPVSEPDRRVISDSDIPAQTELPLLSNVFPESEPALAAKGNELMLLYVSDTEASNPVQFTQISWTHFDGSSWSTPEPLDIDARAQYAPQVSFDGEGNAIAVFERIKDVGYAGSNMEEYAGLMEIVWSRWDASTKEWSSPEPLTDNDVVDFQPALAGTLNDGDLMLVWQQNQVNVLGATTNAPVDILTTRWDSLAGSWETPAVLVNDLTSELSSTLAAGGETSIFLWAQDLDGNESDDSDVELFYLKWNETIGWETIPTRYTADSIFDRNAQVHVTSSGEIFTLWQRGSDLVMDKNLMGNLSVVRSGTDTLGFSDFSLTSGPAGNLILIWQEMNEFGSDAHYRVYDPAAEMWGLDTLLSEDSDVESAFAPVWDASGNLTIAYLNTEIIARTLFVSVEGGDIIYVDGVPQAGQTDLLVAKRAIVRDLEWGGDSLTTEGNRVLPGEVIMLNATVRNSGNVALDNVSVAFFDGDPANGGTEIYRETLAGWLVAGNTNCISYNWTIPMPATAHQIYAVIDPDSVITEFSETNNILSADIGGIDLVLDYQSGEVLRDGSIRIVADITNQGAPASPASEMAIYCKDELYDYLAIKTIEELASGETVQVALDLPAGTHAQGEAIYRLTVGEGNKGSDIDFNNNEITFSLWLWIDDDGDGLPAEWETANGLSDGDASDAEQNDDGDAFTNAQEYKAGTDPQDAGDFLHIGLSNIVPAPSGSGNLANYFSWGSAEGKLYGVQRCYDLTDPNWTTIADAMVATPPLNEIYDELPVYTNPVFYRLIIK